MWIYVLLTIFVSYLLWKYRTKSKKKFPPGPRGLPVVGSLSGISAIKMFDHLERYGEVSSLVIFGTRFVVLNSISVQHEAYMNPTYATVLSGRKQMFFANYVLNRSVTFSSPTDPGWTKQRQLVQEAIVIRGKNTDKIEEAITSELNYVINLLKQKVINMCGMEASDTHNEFDIGSVLAPSLLNIVIILLMGERLDYSHPLCAEIDGMFKQANKLSHPAADFILSIFPFIRFLPIGLGTSYQTVKGNLDAIHKHLLTNCRQKLEENNDLCEGFVYNILRQQQQYDWITDDIIKGSIEDIIGASMATTRVALYSFFLIIIHYTTVQKKIQEEIDNYIGDRKPTAVDRKFMPYTEAVCLELMRYAPNAPIGLPHECSQTITFKGYTIPKNAIILNNIWKCHLGNHWNDPWTFKPERFLDQCGQLVPSDHPNRKNLLPFGIGKRHCIGEQFAKNRIFLYVTTILQAFNILPGSHLPSVDPRDFQHHQNLSPFPYKLRVQLREKDL